MLFFAVVLFVLAALFLVIAIRIYRGSTGLIHDYHQQNVKPEDRMAYARGIGRAMFLVALTMSVSGAVSLFAKTETGAKVSVFVLFVGLALSIAFVVIAQKKYNGGIF